MRKTKREEEIILQIELENLVKSLALQTFAESISRRKWMGRISHLIVGSLKE